MQVFHIHVLEGPEVAGDNVTLQNHTFNPSIIREYDVRGVVGETLDFIDAHVLGRSFGSEIKENGGCRVCVGYDGRLSSPGMERALVDGLISTGVTVNRIGLGPSPMLYFAGATTGADGGVMVTGSHNPPSHNGFKFIYQNKPFYGVAITNLAKRAADGRFVDGIGIENNVAVLQEYIKRILFDFSSNRELTVVWDPGNGAAGEVVSSIAKLLPGRHLVINGKIDGTFPNHHPDPSEPKNLEQLQRVVIDNQADVGFSFDGDGDRLGVIDGKGRIIAGDQILTVLAKDILLRIPGASIIADVKCSNVFFEEVSKYGGNPVIAKTGHSNIKSKMLEIDASLAGEMSGHIFFADKYFGYDDACYAAIRFLSILCNNKKSLIEVFDNIPKTFNTPELRFDCPDERKFQVIEEVRSRLIKSGHKFSDIDGVRVLEDRGWWLLRASNTQALLVARCEAKDVESLDLIKNILSHQLRESNIKTTF